MCPYSRFQGVMFDPTTRTVAYDTTRGEPRRAKGGAGAGDCVDCGICVQVCPTGIDIRDGLQYQCINCGLCADACDTVMTRIAKPAGLIRFASELELSGKPSSARPRLAVYGGLLAAFIGLGAWTLADRSLLLVDVLRDRGSLAREAADGRIENAYTLKIMNLAEAPRDFRVAVSGIDGAEIVGPARFAGVPGGIRTVQLTVAVPAGEGGATVRPIAFEIAAEQDAATRVVEKSTFVLP
jgi:cytochrome c oxidase accessory protein FixG